MSENYTQGLVSITSGSHRVIGVDTYFNQLGNIQPGSLFSFDNQVFYVVTNVIDDDNIDIATLVTQQPYNGADKVSQPYTIIRSFARQTNTELVSQMTAFQRELMEKEHQFYAWMYSHKDELDIEAGDHVFSLLTPKGINTRLLNKASLQSVEQLGTDMSQLQTTYDTFLSAINDWQVNNIHFFHTYSELLLAGTPEDIEPNAQHEVFVRVFNDPDKDKNTVYGWQSGQWQPAKTNPYLDSGQAVQLLDNQKQILNVLSKIAQTPVYKKNTDDVAGYADENGNVVFSFDALGRLDAVLQDVALQRVIASVKSAATPTEKRETAYTLFTAGNDEDIKGGLADKLGNVFLGYDKDGRVDVEFTIRVLNKLIATVKESFTAAEKLEFANRIFNQRFDDTYLGGVGDSEGNLSVGFDALGGMTFSPKLPEEKSLLGPGHCFSLHRSSGKTVDYLARGEGEIRPYRERDDVPASFAMFASDRDIELIPAFGDELCMGGGASHAASTARLHNHELLSQYYAMMFNTGTRYQTVEPIDFAPVKERYDTLLGETGGSMLMHALHLHDEVHETLRNYLYCSLGYVSADIATLVNSTELIERSVSTLARAQQIAAIYKKSIVVNAFTLSLGLHDRATSYDTYLVKLHALVDKIRHVYPNALCIIDQLAAQNNGVGCEATLAQLTLARSRAGVYLSAPLYIFQFVNYQHLTATSYSLLAEYRAKVITALRESAPSPALLPRSAVLNGRIITLHCDVAHPPLTVSDAVRNMASNYGFAVEDEQGNNVLIESVTTLVDSVQITLYSVPTKDIVLSYAYNGEPCDDYSGAWGNICDSDNTPSVTLPQRTLNNYLASFSIQIKQKNTALLASSDGFVITSSDGKAISIEV